MTDIYWIEGMPKGRLGIAPRPRGGDWLEGEIRAWRDAGVGCVVSALTPEEEAELALQDEAAACRDHRLEFVSLPIPDRGTPRTELPLRQVLDVVARNLKSGKAVLIHCRQGIGRASMIAALVLTTMGESPDRAFSRMELARGRPVPDTDEQREWVRQYAGRSGRIRPWRRMHRQAAARKAHA